MGTFSASLALCEGNGQWRGASMFSLISAWANGSTNNRDVSDLRRHRAYYDATLKMTYVNLHKKQVYWDVGYPWRITMMPHERHGVSNQQLTQTNNKENIKAPYRWRKNCEFPTHQCEKRFHVVTSSCFLQYWCHNSDGHTSTVQQWINDISNTTINRNMFIWSQQILQSKEYSTIRINWNQEQVLMPCPWSMLEII